MRYEIKFWITRIELWELSLSDASNQIGQAPCNIFSIIVTYYYHYNCSNNDSLCTNDEISYLGIVLSLFRQHHVLTMSIILGLGEPLNFV